VKCALFAPPAKGKAQRERAVFLMEDRLMELSGGAKVVGTKAVLRALKDNRLKLVFVANDVDTFLYASVGRAAEAAGVPVQRVPAMKELGKACGVEVAAAAAGLLK
jgi:large subunit ribosomal protein L7A